MFNPEIETPELLPIQKEYDGINHSILKEKYKKDLKNNLKMIIQNELVKKPENITEEEFAMHLREKLKSHYPKVRYDLICSGWFVKNLDVI